MPNRLQWAYLTSFFVTFFSLVAISRFINRKLKEAGYDVSRLILIGLPPKDGSTMSTEDSTNTTASGPASLLAGNAPQLLALVLAAATSVWIYRKFGAQSECHVASVTTMNSASA